MIARLYRYLFPPTPLPGDDGVNLRMRRLLSADPLPPPRVRVAEPLTAVEKEQVEALNRSAQRIGEETEAWLRRR